MKHTLILIILIIFVDTIWSQQINKKFVVIEIATGTWCWACPYPSLAADQLLYNGQKVLIIKNNFADNYETPASLSRLNYYGTTILPESFFNGQHLFEGVPEGDDFNDNYLSAINTTTSFDLAIDYSFADSTFVVHTKTTKMADYPDTEIVLQVVVVENHIEHLWQEMIPEISHANRLMLPSPNGTMLDFSSDSVLNHTVQVPLTGKVNFDNSELIVFVQDYYSKEILQAETVPMGYMKGVNNASLEKIVAPSHTQCNSEVTPALVIRNRGNNPLESLQLSCTLNGEQRSRAWSGYLLPNEKDTVFFDSMYCSTNVFDTIQMEAWMPNNQVDDDYGDNNIYLSLCNKITPPITIKLITNKTTDNFSWKINCNGNNIAGAGEYEPNSTFTEVVALDEEGCYEFEFIDADNWGSTEIRLSDAFNQTFYHTKVLHFKRSESVYFNTQKVLPEVVCNIVANDSLVPIETIFELSFNLPIRNLDGTEIQEADLIHKFQLLNSNNFMVSSLISLDSNFIKATIQPNSYLDEGEEYTLKIVDIENASGGQLEEYTIPFKTLSTTTVNSMFEMFSSYPNPANEFLVVCNAKGTMVRLFNMMGVQVHEQNMNSNRVKINTNHMQPGVYLLSCDKYVKKITIGK